ncbi:MAG: DUF3455 domain-containing protein [Methylococcales bacterium]
MMIKRFLLLILLFPLLANAGMVMPEVIRPPVGQVAKLTVHAIGDQIYQCVLENNVYAWQSLAPDAALFDMQGQVVGHHYSGPIWEYKEGSRIVGRVVGKYDVDPSASIPWLLVEVVANHGVGVFSDVQFINRVHTQGGLAPTSSCNANHLGSEKRMSYTADYIFYTAR